MKSLNAASVLPEDGTAGERWSAGCGFRRYRVLPWGRCAETASSTSRHPFRRSALSPRTRIPAGALGKARGHPHRQPRRHCRQSRCPIARDSSKPWLLAPLDLQVLKAAGVTFVVSMLERVIEERGARQSFVGRRDPPGG